MSEVYCTYLTIYSGNKLPPFYIGKSTISRLETGYHGSVASRRYKAIWNKEIRENPSLFKTIILTKHLTDEEALLKEEYFQRYFNVPNNPMYINLAISRKGFGGNKWNNGKYKRLVSSETRDLISKANKGKRRSDQYKLEKSEMSKGDRNPNYGNSWTNDQRQALSKVRRELGLAKGKNNPMYGKKREDLRLKNLIPKAWVTNGTKDHQIPLEQVDEYLSKGFIKGRSNRNWRKKKESVDGSTLSEFI